MSKYLVKAIRQFKPSAEFSFTDDNYSTIKWDVLDGDAPTQKQINEAIEQIKTDEAQAEINKATAKAAVLDRLGLTADEAALLLG